ncbi:hypothetical protein KGQ20_02150 [Catenulispora sp. NF23]|uniref:Uncharacterized protein n=1 Tax=Catenulispora pinistramenti TaxID=2705254 RepID=A0ABS5KIH0_9ACTN|nr:hypothetical protein [Catenulispora pinistramenti]MBS2531567.1 hypothetical protein [Catenulispora pinistramenti]MBS2546183.1 hypothetical protein [Catenulispora pinistramenti]
MPGYANRTVRVEFPELSEPGDQVYVVLRNRKTVPLETLTGPEGADGGEQADPARFSREVIARMVTDWHVYDAFDDAADQAPLPLPATPELVAKLPVEIRTALSKALSPDPTPAG